MDRDREGDRQIDREGGEKRGRSKPDLSSTYHLKARDEDLI